MDTTGYDNFDEANRAAIKRQKEERARALGKSPEEYALTSKPKLDLNDPNVKRILALAKESEDPVLAGIEKYSKYLPLVAQFLQGFTQNMQAGQAAQSPQAPQGPQPPHGWMHMGPLDRLKQKYRNPAWYEAGETWEFYSQTGRMPSSININPVPAQQVADPRYERRRENEGAFVPDIPAREQAPAPEQAKEGQSMPLMEPLRTREEATPPPTTPSTTQSPSTPPTSAPIPSNEAIMTELQKDNARLVHFALDWIENCEPDKFCEYVKNPGQLSDSMLKWLWVVPVHTKAMLKATSREEFRSIVKERCPNKTVLLDNIGKTDALLDELMKLREKL